MSESTELRASQTRADPRWAAVVTRDGSADGQFVYAVSSTGVYCRPSCGARTAKAQHVSFYSTTEQAEQAGFRPCKRCKPEQPPLSERHAALIAELCRQIDSAETAPSLAELAQRANMSSYHLQRLFKALTGVTPKAYATAQRAGKVREQLGTAGSVTEAIYAAGYQANSRFYAQASEVLGMTPKRYRAGGANTRIRFAVGQCSLGAILVASSERGVCAILMGDGPDELLDDLQRRFPRAELLGGDQDFEQQMATVVGFVEAPQLGLDLPLDVRGTLFQQRVWQALREIPVGTTVSYSGLAQLIGAPKSARAVAQACAANALAVAIPCHRVVRNDGGLSGYRWGIERKRALLEREAQA
ncbi:MAG: bifunctional DNA-binding transcriptional regulator/O6-methylguanine-DNA methyltransferase Ada [Pseudomonas sp.]|uniref:bifunctional DNA-binding transcriptional regulator/O6-methylguanine-DNA methyltransferase Ada n=1 Tax=Pseudomonas sp. TaxID=306 RepID=UPI003BB7D73D